MHKHSMVNIIILSQKYQSINEWCLLFQFMLIFRYARDGTLEVEGLKKIAAVCNVAEEGVKGAKSFFESKVNEVSIHTYIYMYTLYMYTL